ncbi:YceI family protein [Aquimarina intermedia]|uniref:Polyisoprenoid-binding protein YceI n=1 Tax=Aquimarina intermedia TaxID=350814 RepID=A0A5S5BX73_9FLAO|nr:YceI family protein [Aquimarina intermedia]TYP70906.1 polyisoprenoid-binding protein YceI [Aquimarina intermedia]
MKTKVMSVFAAATLLITAISCKGENKNETDAAAAEAVKEAPMEAATYTVDTASSTIEWVGSKPTGEHTGTIAVSDGMIKVNADKIEGGTFTVDMKTITVTDLEGDDKASLEGHLKGEGEGKEDHFFNVAQYPTANFEITGISEKEGKTMIDGNLTIKGVKKNISFPATTSMEGDMMSLTSEEFTIDRTEWNVNYASKSVFENLGDKFVNDDIKLKVMIKAKKA